MQPYKGYSMLTVEDVLEQFYSMMYHGPMYPGLRASLGENQWTARFVSNVHQHVQQGKAISTYQSRIILKLAENHRDLLVQHGVHPLHLETLQREPIYRRAPYKSSNIPREVRYIGDNKLAFRFKYDDTVINEIKTLRSPSRFIDETQLPRWNEHHRIWIVPVTGAIIDRVMELIKTHRFGFDYAVVEYLTLALNSKDCPSRCDYDSATNTIRITVCDNEFTAEWVRRMLHGVPT